MDRDRQLLADILESGENYLIEIVLAVNQKSSTLNRERTRTRLLDAVEVWQRALYDGRKP